MDYNGHDFACQMESKTSTHYSNLYNEKGEVALAQNSVLVIAMRTRAVHVPRQSNSTVDTLNRSLVITVDISQSTPLTSSEPASRAGGQLASEIFAWQYFRTRSRGPSADRLETD